jgi:hypothetical protein
MPIGGASETGPDRQNGLATPIRRPTHLAAADLGGPHRSGGATTRHQNGHAWKVDGGPPGKPDKNPPPGEGRFLKSAIARPPFWARLLAHGTGGVLGGPPVPGVNRRAQKGGLTIADLRTGGDFTAVPPTPLPARFEGRRRAAVRTTVRRQEGAYFMLCNSASGP